jgi:hypothetical protein
MTTEKCSREQVDRIVCDQIVHQLARIPGARNAGGDVIRGEHTLEALGFGSLDLLELVDSLETVLLVDPFEQGLALTDVRTVGDLCGVYYRAVSAGATATDENDPVLLASGRRGAKRRQQKK